MATQKGFYVCVLLCTGRVLLIVGYQDKHQQGTSFSSCYYLQSFILLYYRLYSNVLFLVFFGKSICFKPSDFAVFQITPLEYTVRLGMLFSVNVKVRRKILLVILNSVIYCFVLGFVNTDTCT